MVTVEDSLRRRILPLSGSTGLCPDTPPGRTGTATHYSLGIVWLRSDTPGSLREPSRRLYSIRWLTDPVDNPKQFRAECILQRNHFSVIYNTDYTEQLMAWQGFNGNGTYQVLTHCACQ
jgi:hypothetical protein